MRRISVFLVCFLLTTLISFGQEKKPDELLSNAIYLEEVKGNLEEAILIYQDIIKKYPEQRAIAAEALFHLGLSNEKSGNKKAKGYYETLVNSFGDQTKFVRIAKERLSQLILLAEKISKTPLVPKFTKIKIPTLPGNGVLSPDGKMLAYVSEKSLWLLPVQGKTNADISGEPVRLTDPMEAWNLANMGIVWSANGKWLAFYATVTGEDNRKTDEIFIISVEGGTSNKIQLKQQRPDLNGYDYRMSLSHDGKILAFVNYDDNKKPVIYTISITGGTPTKLTSPGTREPAFSPDGKLIAYIKVNPTNNLGSEVWIIPSSGGNPILVSDGADIVKSPVWSPDGSMIAFLARKYKKGWANNSNELWITPVNKIGSPTGLSSKIDLDNSTVSMLSGWSQGNKMGFWFSTPDKNILYTVPATGGQALQVTPKDSWMPDWSPDGRYIYFDGENTNDFAGIESIPVDGGIVTRIPVSSEYFIQPGMPTGGISVSPDGKKIVFAGFYSDIKNSEIQSAPKGFHLMTIPVKGGEPVQLTTNPEGDKYPCWSPDGKSIAFIRTESKIENDKSTNVANIYTISANGGIPQKITSNSDKVTYGRIDWSPDGKWIGYFSEDNAIKAAPLEGGDSKTMVNEVNPYPHFGLSFSPEGDKIVYSNKKKLIVVDINGENKVEVKTGLDGIPTMPSWSPDGEKIAFSAYSKSETELWLMEDFLPKEETVGK